MDKRLKEILQPERGSIAFVINSEKMNDFKKIRRQLILASKRYCNGWSSVTVSFHPYLDLLYTGSYVDGKIQIIFTEK